MLRIINQSVPPALDRLGYSEKQVDDIIQYIVGSGKFENCPAINVESLKKKGLTEKIISSLESQISGFTSLNLLITPTTVGADFCKDKLRVKELDQYLGMHILI